MPVALHPPLPHPPRCDSPKDLQTFPNVPRVQNNFLLRTTDLRYLSQYLVQSKDSIGPIMTICSFYFLYNSEVGTVTAPLYI